MAWGRGSEQCPCLHMGRRLILERALQAQVDEWVPDQAPGQHRFTLQEVHGIQVVMKMESCLMTMMIFLRQAEG